MWAPASKTRSPTTCSSGSSTAISIYNLGAFTPAGAAAQTVSSTVDLRASEVTARLNFKLGGLGLFGM
jgi:hypothetical protein